MRSKTEGQVRSKGEDTRSVEILKGRKRGDALSKSYEMQTRSQFTKLH
jgi:hypothetical protein